MAKEGSNNEERFVESHVDPLEKALQLALLDHASTLRHCLSLFTRPAYLNTQEALTQHLQAMFAPEIALLEPQIPVVPPPKPQFPISPPQSPSEVFSSALPTSPTLSNGNHTSKSSIPQTPPSNDARSHSHLSLGFLKAPPIPNGFSSHPSSTGEDSVSSSSQRSSAVAGSEDGSVTRQTGTETVERPATAHSGRSASMRKRLSILGIGKSNKRSVRKRDRGGVRKLIEE